MSTICPHGRLTRSCQDCCVVDELREELAELREQVATWRRYAAYCANCARVGVQEPRTFDDFMGMVAITQEPA